MRYKTVITKDFNDVSKVKIPENFDEFIDLCIENKFKVEIADNRVLEKVVVVKDIIFYEKGKVGVVTGINEVKLIACNRSAEQMWQTIQGLIGENV